MPEGLYPGYDVLAKRDSESWNEQTRAVIDRRLALPDRPRFFNLVEWRTLNALCARIVPQPPDRPAIPVAALVDEKMHSNRSDGYRDARLPRMQDAWRRALAALDDEARARHGAEFHAFGPSEQDDLLRQMQAGTLDHAAWDGMPPELFFRARLLRDILHAYYSHPTAWSEIGFGGPASPRGYVRMGFDRRDSWEAAEVKDGNVEAARRANRHVR